MKKADFIKHMRGSVAPLKRMIAMIPEDKLNWAPTPQMMSIGQTIKHLSENWIAIKMMVKNEWPPMDEEAMAAAMRVENMPSCSKEEALAGMEKDLNDTIAYLENEISEEAFFTQTVSAPWGFTGAIWEAVMMIRDHTLNHKMQLHVYLKMLGVPVNTDTLYGG